MTGRAAASPAKLEIVQVVRRVHPGGGVGGVAHALQGAFAELGLASSTLTAQDLRLVAGGGRLREAVAIVAFTWMATLAARRARGPGVVVVVHGDALGGDLYVDHGLHRALLARRPWLLLNPLHGFIALRETVRHRAFGGARVACLSDAAEAALTRTHPASRSRPRARLRNGVDLGRFHPEPRQARRDPEAFRLIFVGHEFGRKGLRHVLAALPHLPHGVSLEVLGGRPGEIARARRRTVRLGVASRVAFRGVGADVAARLRDSDLLVLPSAWEASPLAVLEAQASGAPALLADAPWSKEMVLAGGAIAAAPTGPAIAAAVRGLMQAPAEFDRLRQAALARAAQSGWAEVAREYHRLAQAILADRAA